MKKKLVQIISAIVLSVSFISVGASAQSTFTCEIYQTGSASFNSCTNNSNQARVISCQNNIWQYSNNSQQAGTGSAIVIDNTTGGGASSGDASNVNVNDIQIGVTPCVSSTGTTPETPVTPGNGGTTPTPAPVKPAALPYTAGTDATTIVFVSLAAAAGIVALSRAIVAAYNRFGNK